MSILAVKDKPANNEPCGSNPDRWYRLMPAGRQTKETKQRVIDDVKGAIEICNSCPVRQQCLELGMKDENLWYGIWGGKLAAERLVMSGYEMSDFRQGSEAANEFRLMANIYPQMKTWSD